MPGIHHVEVWVFDLQCELSEWGWLLRRLDFSTEQEWATGQSWAAEGVYLTLTTLPNVTGSEHDRRGVGVNHIAFKAGTAAEVDAIMAEAREHGWNQLYRDRYPHAGGPAHYAGWLENSTGFKAEIVADAFTP
ncbi:VOC family protein [uncultured Agrococcus sp.]|uniref:VOC family protein n=1 Tax=uncultured Agrococcus sp. TaxID=382258 RepID=UPI0025FCC3DF|nr:VOC family protein [uncultured Agrococcus sp.]